MSRFDFKQFSIAQDRCAMKVGTDGVLLGAWAEGGRRVLDIGSGTGLISLMMAQRFPDAAVVGIDMDALACQQAAENVANSKFSEKVKIIHERLQDFTAPVFDAIVCNPPFFLNSLKAPDARRSMARHADTLPFRDLLRGAVTLLSDDGVMSVVLPLEAVEAFEDEAYMVGLKLSRKCSVKTVPRKQPKRFLLAFRRARLAEVEETAEVLSNANGSRSEWYQLLTEAFYIK